MSLEEFSKSHEIVIGLEVHAQLTTDFKLMSPASNRFGKSPNSSVSSVCTGMPGALPVLNQKAIEMAVKTALALHCKIQSPNVFSRKHYFYPDLPKGYQISQYDLPYAKSGRVEFYLEGQKRSVGLQRIHMEEDAGKNLHFGDQGISLVDLNRSSVPLIEIVSEPELRSADEAGAYLRALRRVLRYLEVCDGNMEEGNFRCDANVSIRKQGETRLGTRVELKNINSFRNLERAIQNEALRQWDLLKQDKLVVQETRSWDANENLSRSMRSKEEAADYRYFPEPDLLPLSLSDDWIENRRKALPELPLDRMERFMKDFERSAYDAEVLTSSKQLADYFEEIALPLKDYSLASNFIQTTVLASLQDVEKGLEDFYPDAPALTELLQELKQGKLSLNMAKEVFEEMKTSRQPASKIISEKGLSQVNDDSILRSCVKTVIQNHPAQLEQFKAGKDKLFGFFMGQCQKELKGKGNPATLKALLEEELKQS
ncbi:MAG: Asp-tRNA(Asn)/Glu-tRNA(Gln) amidotransferase subunit GatB [Bradymonadales bacterium]|nr:MAG: Asp-tRNA(Asn)/Glu-tRNA(Gln) amidotransferase subunit GatB [Bradymonadales bacterium]